MNIKDLATSEEIKETNVTLQSKVQLKKTFVMAGMQFYRVVAPLQHPHYGSDLSEQGLKDWGIIA